MVFRRGPRPTLAFVALALLLASAAWYKHVASPRYHTVGRASGLLMGARRSPYLWRRHLDGAARGGGRPPPRGSSGPPGARERTPAGGAGEPQPLRFGDPRRGERSRSSSRRDAWAASIPRPARRDPWAALGPPRRPQVTPWRSPALAPSQVERAVRKSPQRRQEAASPFVLVV